MALQRFGFVAAEAEAASAVRLATVCLVRPGRVRDHESFAYLRSLCLPIVVGRLSPDHNR